MNETAPNSADAVLDTSHLRAELARLRRRRRIILAGGLLVLLLAAGLLSHVDAARAADDEAIAAMLATTRLAYVETGDPAIDDVTHTGLRSLTDFIASRSSLEPGDPVAVDPEHDDLALQSLIYWPIDAAAPPPPPVLRRRTTSAPRRELPASASAIWPRRRRPVRWSPPKTVGGVPRDAQSPRRFIVNTSEMSIL